MSNNLTLGSLFDGSGGFPLGGLLSGITPVWASEIEPFPIRVTTRRLPDMKHYGDISAMDGGKIEPVDIICFGSPCTDMSVAGLRAGLGGKQSVLFYEAIRIIKEMRCATNGKYPRWICWENVPGAYSSNSGRDFKAVLDAVIGIVRHGAEVPMPANNKWPQADIYMGDGFSVAYRTLDSQYWGLPHRRKRIFLVGDLSGQCAGSVLFKSEGRSRYSAESFRAWQSATRGSSDGLGTAGGIKELVLNDQGGSRMDVTHGVTCTLRAEAHHPPVVLDDHVVFENHSQDTRYTGPVDVIPTMSRQYGTGGNNQPFVVRDESAMVFGICSKDSNAMKSENPNSGFYEATTTRTIDANGGNPSCNQGGVAIVENKTFCASKASFFMKADEEVAATLCASDYKDPPLINGNGTPIYSVRRLMPTECARLQGFPDWWCSGLGTENPTEEEIAFWTEVWETHRRIVSPGTKPRSRNQVIKWIKNPHSDAAEYKMWGNGVSLPCVFFVLAGIVLYSQSEDE